MRTFFHTPFDQLSTTSSDVLAFAAKVAALPTRLLRAPVEALNRSRREARADAELSALNDQVLADIGLRRAPVGRWRPVDGPCF